MNNKHNPNNKTKLKSEKSFFQIVKDILNTKPNWNFVAKDTKGSFIKRYYSLIGKMLIISFSIVKAVQFHLYLNEVTVAMPQEVYKEIKNDKFKNLSSKDLDTFIDNQVNKYLDEKNKNKKNN